MNRSNPVKIKGTELAYSRSLNQVAGHIGSLTMGLNVGSHADISQVVEALLRYSEALAPWARVIATRMLSDVAKRDQAAWQTLTAKMSRALRDELTNAPTGDIMRELLRDQIHLIQSLPLDAAQRIQDLAVQSLSTSARPKEIAQEIARTHQVSISKATLIARTEISRAAATLTQARATHVGSEGYIWRTVRDASTRPSHKAMEGKFVRWDEPPILDHLQGHAGCLPNCRCFPEPLLPE